ncbi:MAG: Tol-Pal system beta propeller repeat protein TolB [Nitrospinota bacterium]|nr:Tol-Pal system beta propeller repeat protein TolB [Nitrospinota bacterium]
MLRENKIPIIAMAVMAMVAAAGHAVAEEAPDIKITTERTESRLVEVAVAEFSHEGTDSLGLGALAASVIDFDLGFSGYFKTVEDKGFVAAVDLKDKKTGIIDYESWKTISSNFMVKGKVIPEGNSKVSIEVLVYDLQWRKMDFGKRYTSSLTMFRQMLHQFCDDFVHRYTGEPGVSRSRMVFVSSIRGRKELMMVDYDGYNPRQITTERTLVLSPSWNQVNSNLVLFTTYRYRNPDLYVMDLSTKARYPLSTVIGVNSTGEWSPDGARVAFSISRQGNSDIYIVNADGRGLTRITDLRSAELNPTWSPDGKKLAFTSDMSGSPQIYVMNVDGSGRERLSFDSRYSDGAAWSPKGEKLAYASRVYNNFDITVQSMVDMSVKMITEGYGSGNNETPSWARDGRHVVFSSNNTGATQLYISGLDGKQPRRITSLPGGATQPSWGP